MVLRSRRGSSLLILFAAGLLVLAVAAGIYTVSRNPELLRGIRPEASPSPAVSPSQSPSAAAGGAASGSPGPAQPSVAPSVPAAADASGQTASALASKNPRLKCYSSVDCYKANGLCASRLTPDEPGVPSCADCVCQCREQYCQNELYVPN